MQLELGQLYMCTPHNQSCPKLLLCVLVRLLLLYAGCASRDRRCGCIPEEGAATAVTWQQQQQQQQGAQRQALEAARSKVVVHRFVRVFAAGLELSVSHHAFGQLVVVCAPRC
jgi:outer membrane lipopolysaccharide assembly protein LptE/RlpB